MYYKALGYLTHNAIRWYLARKLPTGRQVGAVAGAGVASLAVVAALGLLMRSRRTVPTV